VVSFFHFQVRDFIIEQFLQLMMQGFSLGIVLSGSTHKINRKPCLLTILLRKETLIRR